MKPPAIILAGGRGTRLLSITQDQVPKPMVKIPFNGDSYPFLSFMLGYLREQGFREIMLCINHLGSQIRSYYGDGSAIDMRIRYDDAGHAGTGARVKHALNQIESDEALIQCGDVYHPLDITRFLYQFRFHPRQLMQIAVHDHTASDAIEPNLYINSNGELTGYKDNKSEGQHSVHGSCVLAVRRALRHEIPDAPDVSLTKDIYPLLINKKIAGVFRSNVDFFDVGTPIEYARFCAYVAEHPAIPLISENHSAYQECSALDGVELAPT
ncbi:MAG: NTP transferase domain-containing protein [Gammaproteobacteria bacterium]|nr:NTP transferase domain-containing protein [Gammaproteobacteria bacterium]